MDRKACGFRQVVCAPTVAEKMIYSTLNALPYLEISKLCAILMYISKL
jgi:hypothetical protein